MELILASGSRIRATLLTQAGLSFDTQLSRIDEESMKDALIADGAHPRDIADALAEAKARKVSGRNPDALVLGCDQVLDHGDTILSKPDTPDAARAQLRALSGETHRLHSAIVAYETGQPVWRTLATVSLTMRTLSDAYIDDYVGRSFDEIRHSVGSYQIEAEGLRLFHKIEGDYFAVLGLPMIPLLSWLIARGSLPV